jgi:glucose-1-phosphate cytidylyltransferase
MKVVILCGGKGSRLSEHTRTCPKPLVEIGGKPILFHIMQTYRKYGYEDFVLASGYLGNQISEFASNFRATQEISVIDTGQDTLTGGRLLRLRNIFVKDETFMLTYGDGICSININELVEYHSSHGKIATVTAVRPPARFGVMKLSKNKVRSFQEKSQTDSGWINGGYFVFNSQIFDFLENDNTVLEESPMQKLSKMGQLMAFRHEGFWQCMDTLRDKEYLDNLCISGHTPWL